MAKRAKHVAHGGAWKVAYADFTTSMMCLFLVLWLVSSDSETRAAIQQYFRGDIKEVGHKGTFLMPNEKPRPNNPTEQATDTLMSRQQLNRVAKRLQEQFSSAQDADELIRFEFMADGIRITALDKAKKPFFDPGTPNLTEFGKWVLQTIAWEVERFPFNVEVEGHTQQVGDGKLVVSESWNLSSSRAVSARDALQSGGIKTDQFYRVAGYGDRSPIDEVHPEAEENRRITVVVRPKGGVEMQDLSNELQKR